MDCYLCGRKSGKVAVEVGGTQFVVCGVCDERGVFCDSCDKPLRADDSKYEVLGAWDTPTGRFDCEACAEGAYDRYQESMVMS
jgi:hypothetical protein